MRNFIISDPSPNEFRVIKSVKDETVEALGVSGERRGA
jgi:hypothetical protein